MKNLLWIFPWRLLTDPLGIQLEPQMEKPDGRDWSVMQEEEAEG